MIRIMPTETRFVDIHHEGWGLDWSIQFPEAIVSAEGSAMSWEPIHPGWEQDESGAWRYAWRTTREYLEGLQHVDAGDLVMGLALEAGIWVEGAEVRTELTISNESGEPFHEVRSST